MSRYSFGPETSIRPDHYIPSTLSVRLDCALPSEHNMAIELAPIALPATASGTDFDPDFGREVKGVNPGELTPEQFKEVEIALYTVGSRIFACEMHLTYALCSMESCCSEMSLSHRNNSML